MQGQMVQKHMFQSKLRKKLNKTKTYLEIKASEIYLRLYPNMPPEDGVVRMIQ